jgi:two-component system chemotaxis response regulator CheB
LIRVFVIDDSKLIIEYFKKIFDTVKDIKLIGTAFNPVDAMTIIEKKGYPDIFIIDIEMPKMDGLTFLKNVAVKKKIPTIVCSHIAQKNSPKAIEALKIGAVDIIPKRSENFVNYHIDIIDKIKDIIAHAPKVKPKIKTITKCKIENQKFQPQSVRNIVGIASSTGGIPVLDNIIQNLQPNHPPIVIVQHMQDGFTQKLAHRLNEAYEFTNVKEAAHGDVLMRGRILIAKSGIHSMVVKDKIGYKIEFSRIPPVDYHKPSGTVLFKSMAKSVKENSIGIILTGMGSDGASGLKEIQNIGGVTMAQSKASCAVYGMPKQAVEIGAVSRTTSVKKIIETINSY